MPDLSDPTYLKNVQYRDSANLAARAGLHQQFRTNKISWQLWLQQQLQIPPNARVLEIGCGPAYFWLENRSVLNKTWQVALSDLSQGMLEEARASLSGIPGFSYTTLDGTFLPFPSRFFDAVIANHMLYHLPDIPQALQEIKRVLKPAGCLYAATNGKQHLREIRQWAKTYLPDQQQGDWGTPAARFNLENGPGLLEAHFHAVQMRLYPNRLEIDQVEPVLRYIESYTNLDGLPGSRERLRAFLEDMLVRKGQIAITAESGLFLAVKR